MLRLDYEIHDKKGVENKVANILSRREEGSQDATKHATLMAITIVKPKWIQELVDSCGVIRSVNS